MCWAIAIVFDNDSEGYIGLVCYIGLGIRETAYVLGTSVLAWYWCLFTLVLGLKPNLKGSYEHFFRA